MKAQTNRIVFCFSFLFLFCLFQLTVLQAEENSSLPKSKLASDSKVIDQTCPQCGSSSVDSIIYGEPNLELMEAAQRREVVLGGCVIRENSPKFVCKQCGSRWGSFNIKDS